MQEYDGKNERQYGAELVNSDYRRGKANLQCLEVAEPRCTGRQAGQDEKEPAFV